jgi:hypothetical protein
MKYKIKFYLCSFNKNNGLQIQSNLDAEEDIFRDIAILADDTLEDLHNAIFNSFGFDGMEVASFYTCDETWNQEDEISLLTLVMLSASRKQ